MSDLPKGERVSIGNITNIAYGKGFRKKYKPSIFAKAFRGELVPQDPNDEPALKLLEKIKVEKAKQGSKRNNKKRQSHRVLC